MKSVLVDLPFSRTCESEADFIGLLLMAKSCYDPEEAIELWKRMDENDISTNHNLISFLSTHPSHSKRIENIRSWLPRAKEIFDKSECNNFLLASFYNKSRPNRH